MRGLERPLQEEEEEEEEQEEGEEEELPPSPRLPPLVLRGLLAGPCPGARGRPPTGLQMDSAEKTTNRSEQKSRKFLKSLIRKQPHDLLLVIGTGVSAAVAPGIRALCSWRSCIEAVLEAAEQLEVLHPGDVAEFRKKVMKDRDLLVVAHDLIRKMSPRTGDTKPNFFQDCLMEVFDNLEQHIQNPTVLQSILSLMERGTMVLTTNYDNLLEIFGQQQNKPMESLDLKDKTKVLQWARGHMKYGVLHIHGLYTDPCGMVLDPSGYKDVTQDPEVMEVLQNLYWTKSFLFVGGREHQLHRGVLLFGLSFPICKIKGLSKGTASFTLVFPRRGESQCPSPLQSLASSEASVLLPQPPPLLPIWRSDPVWKGRRACGLHNWTLGTWKLKAAPELHCQLNYLPRGSLDTASAAEESARPGQAPGKLLGHCPWYFFFIGSSKMSSLKFQPPHFTDSSSF
ncbi:protein FAM118A isoform X1 [Sarcophilus harrisii]|uniref:protein FAM118A isoform X1 n=1 Tax=Sarcophilus harrisii TaxID=9305 RepID=UPI001301E0B3|nr:protein FAM118A isoform X1 [Sarcophilus harrisii]